MGPIGCLETSVTNYQSALRNILGGRRSLMCRGGSLKPHEVCKAVVRTSWSVQSFSSLRLHKPNDCLLHVSDFNGTLREVSRIYIYIYIYIYRVPKKHVHILRKEKKLYWNCNTQFIPITKLENKSLWLLQLHEVLKVVTISVYTLLITANYYLSNIDQSVHVYRCACRFNFLPVAW